MSVTASLRLALTWETINNTIPASPMQRAMYQYALRVLTHIQHGRDGVEPLEDAIACFRAAACVQGRRTTFAVAVDGAVWKCHDRRVPAVEHAESIAELGPHFGRFQGFDQDLRSAVVVKPVTVRVERLEWTGDRWDFVCLERLWRGGVEVGNLSQRAGMLSLQVFDGEARL